MVHCTTRRTVSEFIKSYETRPSSESRTRHIIIQSWFNLMHSAYSTHDTVRFSMLFFSAQREILFVWSIEILVSNKKNKRQRNESTTGKKVRFFSLSVSLLLVKLRSNDESPSFQKRGQDTHRIFHSKPRRKKSKKKKRGFRVEYKIHRFGRGLLHGVKKKKKNQLNNKQAKRPSD